MSAECAKERVTPHKRERVPSESKFVIKLVSLFGKQTHIMTSGDVTGLALRYASVLRESVRVL